MNSIQQKKKGNQNLKEWIYKNYIGQNNNPQMTNSLIPIDEGNHKRIIHLIIYDLDTLSHVQLHKSQLKQLDSDYRDKHKKYKFKNIVRVTLVLPEEVKKLIMKGQKKRKGGNPERDGVFRMLEKHYQQGEFHPENPIAEEMISDAESVRSQQSFRKMQIDSQGIIVIQGNCCRKELIEIGGIEKIFKQISEALGNYGLDISLISLNISPRGFKVFVQKFGCHIYFNLITNFNWQFLGKSQKSD